MSAKSSYLTLISGLCAVTWSHCDIYHKSFLANSHTYSNITLYIISVCYSAGKLHACTYNLKTHQHVFITSTRFAEPWQDLWNLDKVCGTSTRFVKPWQGLWNLNKVFETLMRFILLWWGNTLDLLRTEGILEKEWCYNVIT